MVRTQIKNKAEIEINPLTQYLKDLIANPELNDDLDKGDFINKIRAQQEEKGIKEKDQITKNEFNQLIKRLEQFWGLEKTSKESWLQFFERAIFEIDDYDAVAQEITEGQVPENMQELVKELDTFKKELKQIRQKTKLELPKESDRFITRLMEKYQGKFPEGISQQEITTVAAEQELEDYVNQTADSPGLQARAEQNQQRFERIVKMNKQNIKRIISAQDPQTDLNEELNFISTTSLGTNTAWHQPIKQKYDNSAEIIGQIEKAADTKTLDQQAKIAEQVEPVLREHIDFEAQEVSDQAIESASGDIASSLMTAKAKNWQIETNESSTAGMQTALSIANQDIELKKPTAMKEIVDAALDPLSNMEINPQAVETINKINIQSNVAQHLTQKGLDLSPKQIAEFSETTSVSFFIPEKTEIINRAFHSYPENDQGEKEPNLINRLSGIPKQPSRLLKTYQEDEYQSFLKQIFAFNYAKNFTPSELNQEISRLSQMQSYLRTTTERGPIIDSYSLQLDAAQTVINHPLYKTVSPLVRIGKSKIINKLGQTAVGQGIKTGLNKAGSWMAQQAAKAGIKLAGEGAVSGTIAAALGIELLKIGAKKLFGGVKKFFKGIGSAVGGFFGDIFSSSKAEATRQKAGILETLQKGGPLVGAAITSLLTIPSALNIGPIIITSFIIFFGFMLLGFFPQHLMTQSRRRPPLGRGGEGVAQGELGIDTIEVDLSTCDIPDANAKKGCTLTQAFNQCFSEGKITSSNTHLVEDCIRKTEALMTILSESEIRHIVDSISYSANTYSVLQCVGFKRAVEPGLPGCGDAKDFINAGCNRCRSVDTIQPGVNAVFTGGTFGHIAIVVKTDPENGLITVSQAWGGSGRVNFTQIPAASVAEFIDCR